VKNIPSSKNLQKICFFLEECSARACQPNRMFDIIGNNWQPLRGVNWKKRAKGGNGGLRKTIFSNHARNRINFGL